MDAKLTPKIDGKRLYDSLMTLARIGATPKGGVKRLALTDEDRAGRDLVTGWCREAGLAVRVDEVGNIFARRAGTENRPAVAVGSHIDTQPSGGKFDGNYGVLSGLEVLRRLNDLDIRTKAPIDLCIWMNEEGSRFTPTMMGSGAFIGDFTADYVRAQVDVDGKSVGQELERIGYRGTSTTGEVPGGTFAAYFEAHIEQGPILEDKDIPIGVVQGALGQKWYDIVVTGQDAHAGPTPLELRHDALLAAAGMIEEVNRIAREGAPSGRGTVGFVQVTPNSRNVIPGLVKFSVDFRHWEEEGLKRMDAVMRERFADIAKRTKTELSIQPVVDFTPCHFARECVAEVRHAAEALDLPHMDIVSGAGHDAVNMARIVPTAMIFIPCKDGISHNELEDARPEHIEMGCNVLMGALLAHAELA